MATRGPPGQHHGHANATHMYPGTYLHAVYRSHGWYRPDFVILFGEAPHGGGSPCTYAVQPRLVLRAHIRVISIIIIVSPGYPDLNPCSKTFNTLPIPLTGPPIGHSYRAQGGAPEPGMILGNTQEGDLQYIGRKPGSGTHLQTHTGSDGGACLNNASWHRSRTVHLPTTLVP